MKHDFLKELWGNDYVERLNNALKKYLENSRNENIERNILIFNDCYFNDMDFVQIAEKYGLTKARSGEIVHYYMRLMKYIIKWQNFQQR